MRWNQVHPTSLTASCFRVKLHWNFHLLTSYITQFITFIPKERLRLPFQLRWLHPLVHLPNHSWNLRKLLWISKLICYLQMLHQAVLEECMAFILFMIVVELPKLPKKSHSYHLRTMWTIHPPATVHTVHEVVLMAITTTLIILALILVILRIPGNTLVPAQEAPLVAVITTIPIVTTTIITPVLIPIPVILLNNLICNWK